MRRETVTQRVSKVAYRDKPFTRLATHQVAPDGAALTSRVPL